MNDIYECHTCPECGQLINEQKDAERALSMKSTNADTNLLVAKFLLDKPVLCSEQSLFNVTYIWLLTFFGKTKR